MPPMSVSHIAGRRPVDTLISLVTASDAVTEINGFTMHFEDRGSGQPLLLLHGGMGIGADWRHVFPEDPAGYRVIVPDLRGHGRSTNPAGTFTFRQCAEDVLALLDHLGIARTNAIGMSMGAKTLLHVVTSRPDSVDAMVLVSATPRFPPSLATRLASSHARRSIDCPTPRRMRYASVTSMATNKSPRQI